MVSRVGHVGVAGCRCREGAWNVKGWVASFVAFSPAAALPLPVSRSGGRRRRLPLRLRLRDFECCQHSVYQYKGHAKKMPVTLN